MTKAELRQHINTVAKVAWFLGKDPDYYPGLTLDHLESLFTENLWAEFDR